MKQAISLVLSGGGAKGAYVGGMLQYMKLRMKKLNGWLGGRMTASNCLFTGDYMRSRHDMNG